MSLIAASATIAILGGGGAAGTIGYDSFVWAKARYHVVTANLASGRVRAGTVHASRLTSVWGLVAQAKPLAAITGTFFSPASQRPVADLLVDGKLVAKGSRGSGIGVGWFGDVTIFDSPYRTQFDWTQYRYGLRGAVRIVNRGKVQADPKAQRFRDRRIWGRAARTGIGLTANGKLVLVATARPVTLSELGRAMVSRGVRDGISLDGGGSTCLYYRGSLVVPPKRKLSNLFVLSPAPAADTRIDGLARVPSANVTVRW